VNDFESGLNSLLTELFNNVLKFEEQSIKTWDVPITITEVHIIEAVNNQENTTTSKIAAELNIAMPTATVAVKKLEQKSLIEKTPCPDDRRSAIIKLTDMGKKINRLHQLFHRRMIRNVSKQIASAERDVLLRAVQTLNLFFRARIEAL